MSNHHLRLISGSTIFQQSSSWSFRYPSSDAAVIQFSLFKLCLNFSLHGCKRFMVTRMEFHFGWVYTLSVQSDSLRNRCTPTSKPVSTQQSRAQLCGSSCKHPSLAASLVIFFTWPFHSLYYCGNVLYFYFFLEHLTQSSVWIFSVFRQTVYFRKREYIISLLPTNYHYLLAFNHVT